MENKHFDSVSNDPDGTVPFTGSPFVPGHSKEPSDQDRQNSNFDLTTPNIPYLNEQLSIPPVARANNNFDLTEMKIHAFDESDGDTKVVTAQPEVNAEPRPAITSKSTKSRQRRRVPLWLLLVSSGVVLCLLSISAIAVFVLWPRNLAFTLKVLEAPPGSKVLIDGLPSGVPQSDGTIVVHGLRADEVREVIVKHDQFNDWNTSIRGEAGKELVVTAKLTPKMTAPSSPKEEIDYTGLMVLVPAGTFVMGDNNHRPDERPEHEVILQSYYIDKFEVTNEQYQRFCDETHRSYPPSPFWNPQYFESQPHSPVVGVSWDDAMAYAKWAGKRLPTEEEWEKAASWDESAQKKRQWPWGNSPEKNRANLGLERTAVNLAAANGNAAGASAYAVQDMAGNAAEWVDAYYQPYPGNTTSNPEFGTKNRVVRGGTSVSNFEDARSTRRFPRSPDYTAEEKTNNAYLIGFRCAVSAGDPKLQEFLKGKSR
jgi:formylglycine-generating enzyme required for sulfatase activity